MPPEAMTENSRAESTGSGASPSASSQSGMPTSQNSSHPSFRRYASQKSPFPLDFFFFDSSRYCSLLETKKKKNKFTSYPTKSLLAVSISPKKAKKKKKLYRKGFRIQGWELLRVTKGKIFNLSGSNITEVE